MLLLLVLLLFVFAFKEWFQLIFAQLLSFSLGLSIADATELIQHVLAFGG
jgi:hypothetical protein